MLQPSSHPRPTFFLFVSQTIFSNQRYLANFNVYKLGFILDPKSDYTPPTTRHYNFNRYVTRLHAIVKREIIRSSRRFDTFSFLSFFFRFFKIILFFRIFFWFFFFGFFFRFCFQFFFWFSFSVSLSLMYHRFPPTD